MTNLEQQRRDLIGANPHLYEYIRHKEAAKVLDSAGDTASGRDHRLANNLWAASRLHREAALKVVQVNEDQGEYKHLKMYSVEGVDGHLTLLVNGEVVVIHGGRHEIFHPDQLMARQVSGEPLEMTRDQLRGLGELITKALGPPAADDDWTIEEH